MKRCVAILLVAWFLALGTGVVEYLHNLQHEQEDAQLASSSSSDKPHPIHDDSNCRVHAQLHAPRIATPPVVLLIVVGLFVAFLTQLACPLVSARVPARIDCRGPPLV